MTRAWLVRCGAFLGTLALVSLGMSVPAEAGDSRTRVVEMEDRCDPASFNAALDPEGDDPVPPCVDNGQEFITFDRFLERLEDGGDNHWDFDPSDRTIRHGDRLKVRNTGGEFHTFTEVTRFGQGCVPELNAAVPDEGPALIPGVGACPADPASFLPIFFATGTGAGGSINVENLSVGVHRFECLIHPWMRSTITVEPR